jgi:hypothetical protein
MSGRVRVEGKKVLQVAGREQHRVPPLVFVTRTKDAVREGSAFQAFMSATRWSSRTRQWSIGWIMNAWMFLGIARSPTSSDEVCPLRPIVVVAKMQRRAGFSGEKFRARA